MIDQDKHEAFEKLCNGPTRAFQLMRIWEGCANPVWGTMPHTEAEKAQKRVKIFRHRAFAANFTKEQVNAFLDIQD